MARLPASLDPARLVALPRFRHYFRYPLHHGDFRPLRGAHLLLGYYAAKPLYGRLDAQRRVDRSSGYDGGIAGVFVPSPARSLRHARLFFAHMPPDEVMRGDRRNWPAIRAAAEAQLRRDLGRSQRPL